MTHAFPKNQNLVISVKHVLSQNLNDAIMALSSSKGISPEKFKEARKSIKRARAALRLIQDSLSGKWLDREEDILKDVSRVFRDVRDTQVSEEVFSKVLEHYKDRHPKHFFSSIHENLKKTGREIIDGFSKDEKKIKNTIAELQVALERVGELEIKGEPWKVVKEGLKHSYTLSLDAFEDSCANRSDESYIEWRRSVKFLRIQLDYLSELLTKEGNEFNNRLHPLSDSLGAYQDILMLIESIKEDTGGFGEKETVNLALEFLEERMKHEGKEARKAGEDLFKESPKRFINWALNEEARPKEAIAS